MLAIGTALLIGGFIAGTVFGLFLGQWIADEGAEMLALRNRINDLEEEKRTRGN